MTEALKKGGKFEDRYKQRELHGKMKEEIGKILL